MSEDAEITEIACEECRGRGSFRPPRGCPCGCDDEDCPACEGAGTLEIEEEAMGNG